MWLQMSKKFDMIRIYFFSLQARQVYNYYIDDGGSMNTILVVVVRETTALILGIKPSLD